MDTENSFHEVDYIIIGAGIYGLYIARLLGRKGFRVVVLEKENKPFQRASYINQARLHMGYHYPRSISTARKTAQYFERFFSEFRDCINDEFEQIYAISKGYSYTDASQFIKFCKAIGIKCEETGKDKFFNAKVIEEAFLTNEYSFDAAMVSERLLRDLELISSVKIVFNSDVNNIERIGATFRVNTGSETVFYARNAINTTYAGINHVSKMIGGETIPLKYELCEVILCNVSENLRNTGITVMDGPFFSIMPFGKTKKHSLTSVTFTPHMTSREELPTFTCMERSNQCRPFHLENCNTCKCRPETSWHYMEALARKYLKDEYRIEYEESLFTIKPILMRSEVDDSRPTIVREESSIPGFWTVLSGKINTVYDLEKVFG